MQELLRWVLHHAGVNGTGYMHCACVLGIPRPLAVGTSRILPSWKPYSNTLKAVMPQSRGASTTR